MSDAEGFDPNVDDQLMGLAYDDDPEGAWRVIRHALRPTSSEGDWITIGVGPLETL